MGMFSIVGDIMINVGDILSTVGGVQYHGGYHEYLGGYLEYQEDSQYRGESWCTWRYHEYCGGCSILWEDTILCNLSTVGDSMSTVWGVQYHGGTQIKDFPPWYWTPHGTHDIPHVHHDIPHCTEHPHNTAHPHSTTHTLYRVQISQADFPSWVCYRQALTVSYVNACSFCYFKYHYY